MCAHQDSDIHWMNWILGTSCCQIMTLEPESFLLFYSIAFFFFFFHNGMVQYLESKTNDWLCCILTWIFLARNNTESLTFGKQMFGCRVFVNKEGKTGYMQEKKRKKKTPTQFLQSDQIQDIETHFTSAFFVNIFAFTFCVSSYLRKSIQTLLLILFYSCEPEN